LLVHPGEHGRRQIGVVVDQDPALLILQAMQRVYVLNERNALPL